MDAPRMSNTSLRPALPEGDIQELAQALFADIGGRTSVPFSFCFVIWNAKGGCSLFSNAASIDTTMQLRIAASSVPAN